MKDMIRLDTLKPGDSFWTSLTVRHGTILKKVHNAFEVQLTPINGTGEREVKWLPGQIIVERG